MDRILQDLRYGLRMLSRSPGSITLAVGTLAVATGLSTSIFTLVNAISLRPLPYAEPAELLHLSLTHRETQASSGVSGPDALDWRLRSRTLADLAIYKERQFGVRLGAAAEEMVGTQTSGNVFRLLGVPAVLGRTLRPEDEHADAPPVVVISHQLWRNRLGEDPGVIGRSIRIDRVSHEIVGVMPDGFGFYDFAQLWIPLRQTALGERETRTFDVVARRRPQSTVQQVTTELMGLSNALADAYPTTNRAWKLRLRRLQDERRQPISYGLVVAGVLVLLIACANVGNLLLARGATRHAELAVRRMMGASRGRVLRQLMTESVVIALIGSALGLLASLWGIDLLVHLLPFDQLPLWIDFSIDGRVLGFTIAGMILAVLTIGLLPALSITRDELGEAIKSAGRRTAGAKSTTRTRNTLIVAQLALSLVLLASAGLLLRATVHSAHASPGFDPDPVLNLHVPLNAERYANDAARIRYVDQALRVLHSLDAVESAAVEAGLPASRLGGGGAPTAGSITAAGVASDAPLSVTHTAVSPRFFATLRLPVLRGRAFREVEIANAVILSHGLAERLWPGADPLGRSVKFGTPADKGEWLTVVGVVADRYHIAMARERSPRTLRLDVYLPAGRGTDSQLTFLVRARDGRPLRLAAAARRALHGIDPDQPITRVTPYAAIVYVNVRLLRWLSGFAGTVALAALVLSAVGLFGVIAYAVTQRTREIGIRVALGARPEQVVHMMTITGTRLALTGVAIGVVATLAMGRLLASVIFGVSPYNPLVLAAVALVLSSVAVAASWLPARRAARVNPVILLQAE